MLNVCGKSRKTFRSAPFICAPHPATPHSQALAASFYDEQVKKRND
jgi:hypothetical protein